jgi:NAD(P)-dependent dehydrogenase (short-subunit alcohol dehydrogenase family)
MDAWSLSGKVMLITGGARGIGAATARELARRGALPVLADLDTDALAATAAGISPTPVTVELDVTDLQACEAAVQRVLEEHKRLDVVWANAGIGSGGPLQLTDPAAWRRTVEVNLLGAYNTICAALPAVIEQRGYVAVTASAASFAHSPGMSAYAASKAGVEAMANSLRIEIAHHGVDVATIHPTWIDTDMVREADDIPAFKLLRGALRPPFKKTYPVGRAVTDIVAGFEQRRRRICVPRFVFLAHAMRPLLTTRLIERDQLAIAPELERSFRRELGERGRVGASVSERTAKQLAHANDPARANDPAQANEPAQV